ncbi:MAG: glycosyltransferase family 4 protein [Deltaproteobacteria bacterium]|nr:glycosyltransferase family 4 protein [Deltaproteobacteria bacterium]MBN2688611.1 glycosyltransferase family 4 protein [Deltaproteobacteria bacterium]
MKVLMFGWEYPPFISGGLGTACYGITQGLAEQDVEVVFVVPRMRGRMEGQHIRLIDGSTVRLREEDIGGMVKTLSCKPIDAFLIPYMNEESYREALEKAMAVNDGGDDDRDQKQADDRWSHYGPDLWSEVFRYGKVARHLAGQESFDVIHVHDWMTMPAGIEAKQETGKPLVVHVHALESDRTSGRINERIYGIEREGMMRADCVIAVSHYTKRKIVDQYGIEHGKISVVHNAVTHGESRQRCSVVKNPDRPCVLFLGRMTYQKGPDYFLEAAAKIVKKNNAVTFIMAGSGDMLGSLKEEVVRLGIENNVSFTGFLRGTDVEAAYAVSDLYVMPSVSEPFGITALEAVMYDVPVIVSSQAGVCEILKNCPTVDFWDTDGLAHKILEILEKEELRVHIVRRCRDEMKHVSWKIAGGKIKNVYRTLMMV